MHMFIRQFLLSQLDSEDAAPKQWATVASFCKIILYSSNTFQNLLTEVRSQHLDVLADSNC